MKKKISLITVVSLFISIIPFVIYFYVYDYMPKEIAIHYDINGIATRFIEKNNIEVMLFCTFPLIILIIIRLSTWILVRSFEKSDNPNIKITRFILDFITILLVIVFTILITYYLFTAANITNFNMLYLLMIINIGSGILFITFGNYLSKFLKNNISGFRTKASLSDDDIWFKTQRFGGRLLTIGGIVMILLSITIGMISLIVSLCINPAIITIIIIIIVIYSNNKSSDCGSTT